MDTIKPFSFFFFILCLFYAPILQPYIPKTNFGAGIPDFGFYELSLFLWLTIFMLDMAFGKFQSIQKCNIRCWLVLLSFFSTVVCFSVLWSYETFNTATIHSLFFTIFIPLSVACLSQYYFQSKKILSSIAFHAATSCIFFSIASIIHFITSHAGNIKEIRGGFGGLENPNAMAIFLVLNVPILLLAINQKLLNKKFAITSLAIILLGILATISRKGYITLAATYFIFLFLNKKIKLLIATILIFFLITGVIIARTKIMSQRYTKTAIKTEFAGKWNMTIAGFKMFLERPIYGWGFKGYYNKFGEYFKYSHRKKYDAHNNYITALANYGLLGFILFISIFLYPLFRALRTIRRSTLKSIPHLGAISLVSMLIPFMTSAWFAGNLMYQPIIVNLLYFYIVLYICISTRYFNKVSINATEV